MNNTEALRAAAQQALAAMEKYPVTVNHWKAVLLPAADALREALAQPAASGEPAGFRVSVQPIVASNGTTHLVCIDHPGRPLGAAPWDAGRVTPSQHEDPDRAEIEAQSWREFFAGTGRKRADILADSVLAATAQPAPARVPLTDEQISNMWAHECVRERLTRDLVQAFARAIEAAHGITAPGAPDAGPHDRS